MNVLSDNGKKEYLESVFTEKGISTLETYLEKTLLKEYFERKEYPFQLGLVFGLPMFDFSQVFESKDDLLGRIKCLMHILGKKSIVYIDQKGNKKILQFEVKHDN